MFTDIFSSFDPDLFTLLKIKPIWLLCFIILPPLTPTFWMAPPLTFWVLTLPMNMMMQQLTRTTGHLILGWSNLLSTLFICLATLNLIGLFPYSFSHSSHLIFTSPFGTVLWGALILSSALHRPMKFLAMILPGGAPSWLNPFLVSVESSSTSARPGTLSFRLAANMSAGHIVIALISVYMITSFFHSSLLLAILITILTYYLMFELGICMIQAFVFCLLLSLYSNEHT